MTSLMIEQFICRQDNFCVILHDPLSGETASIDAPDGTAIAARLEKAGYNLTHIFVTHHHGDHVEGIPPLVEAYSPEVLGPEAESGRIKGLTRTLKDGDSFTFAGRKVDVISTPGHTAGHICFHIPDEDLLFAGDTLFALGCGRLFEGTPKDMFTSLSRLAQLPDQTRVYCGHEYTLSNGRFAVTVDPENEQLAERVEEVITMRGRNEHTLPTTIGFEKRTNPFLRSADASIRANLGMQNAGDAEVFAELRRRKDSF